MELITGNTPYISHLLNFDLHYWIKHWEPLGFPKEGKSWVGV